MGFSYLADSLSTSVYNADVTGSGGSSTAVDLVNLVGPIMVTVDDRASGTAAATITVEHSADNSTWATVAAAAIMNPATGAASAFANLSTSASTQTKAINRELLRRYIRVTLAGTTIDHNVAILVQGLKAQTS